MASSSSACRSQASPLRSEESSGSGEKSQPQITGIQIVHLFPLPGATEAVEEPAAPSEGSLGHPVLCHRPCVLFTKGQCDSGENCSYCHLPHKGKSTFLDKREREKLKNMDLGEVLSTILPFVRSALISMKAPASTVENQRRLYELLEEGCTNTEHMEDCEAWRSLGKTLRRMPLSALLACVVPKADDEYLAAIKEQVEELRSAHKEAGPGSNPLPKVVDFCIQEKV